MRRRIAFGLPAALLTHGTLLPAGVHASWQQGGLSGLSVRRLVSDPVNPGVLYAAASSALGRTGLFKSIDAGRSWFGVERGLPVGFVPSAFALSAIDGRIALAGGVEGIFRSTDAGTTWSAVPGRFPPITALHVSPHDPGHAWAGTELNGTYRSDDGGRTWRAASRGLTRSRYGTTPGGIAFASHPTEPNVLLMATTDEIPLYRTRNGGESWEPASGAGPGLVHSLTFAVETATALALQEKALLRSTNAGESWQAVPGTPTGGDYTCLALGGERREQVFLGTARGTLHRSTNGGVSWAELPALPASLRALAAWPGTSLSALPTVGAAVAEGIRSLTLRPTLPYSPEPAAANRQYFPETGHNVSPTFLPFFRARGALDRFGPPRTEELTEDGVLVQYFQRARLEYRPEFRNTAYEVQISLLGQQIAGVAPAVEPFESSADQRYFSETGHSVSYAFLRYFNARGGLDSFGFPITEEMQLDGRPVQYFQRARLEYRADLAGRADEVQPAAIGDEVLRQKGWLD